MAKGCVSRSTPMKKTAGILSGASRVYICLSAVLMCVVHCDGINLPLRNGRSRNKNVATP